MPGYNQYIGMRYVPIVDGDWSQSKAYEPLVVVVYNGNSYISKTYVPAGTLPTNETYWILAANYNAQVEQYRQEVRQYQEIVENFDTDISDLETDVGNLQTTVGNHQTAIEDNTEDIASLQTFVDSIGDSLHESGSVAVSANNVVDVCSIVLPVGKWLLLTHLDMSSAGSGNMANIIITPDGSSTVRTTESGGGGALNATVYVATAQATIKLQGFANHATTLRGKIDAIKL